MRARPKSHFVCQQCGYQSPKWLGKCPECQAWNGFAEEIEPESMAGKARHSLKGTAQAIPLDATEDDPQPRLDLPLGELNRVLGGGLTKGSVVLIAGDPGIGKSTLLLQLLGSLNSVKTGTLLYISGEESVRQIRLRALRLRIKNPRLNILAETDLSLILPLLENDPPEIVVVDSIQTLFSPDLTSVPGSVSQVREAADRLVRFAKARESTLFLVGHVTKEGGIAGPMALEHLVDTVLFLEGDKGHPYRLLRALKNRFGPTDEVGVLDMAEEGLKDVANPSELFLRDRPANTPGTVVFPALEGSRTLLVEVQGLASKSYYGMPMRTCNGFDKNRLTMLLAVLEKRGGLRLSDHDVYVNVVGGLTIDEPAADLAVAAAVVSSFHGKAFPAHSVAFGEIGLAGEVRAIPRSESRLKEAKKLGFSSAYLPSREARIDGIDFKAIRSIAELVSCF